MDRGRKTTQADVDEILEMRSRGMTQADMARETGLAHNTITRILDGWRPVGRKPVRLRANPRPSLAQLPPRRFG